MNSGKIPCENLFYSLLEEDYEYKDDDVIEQEDNRIYDLMIKINQVIEKICEIKRKYLEDFRNAGKKENEEPYELNEVEVKYIYSKEVMKTVYEFMRISKDCERKYIDLLYHVGDENKKLK